MRRYRIKIRNQIQSNVKVIFFAYVRGIYKSSQQLNERKERKKRTLIRIRIKQVKKLCQKKQSKHKTNSLQLSVIQ